jgi:murein biosynthesis integral membrane protein MurJ
MATGRVVRGLAGAAVLIAAVTAVSRVVGFGRVLVFSKTIGDTCLGDVYNTANLLPNVAFEVVAGGALASVVVPLLVGRFDRGENAEASQTMSALLTWTLVVLVPVAIVLAVVAQPVIGFFLGGDDACGAEAVDVGARMVRIFAPQIPLYGVAVVIGGALQARRSYLPSAAAPIVGSLVVIPAYLLFATMASGRTPLGELSTRAELVLSVGTTLGVVGLAAATVLPALRRHTRVPYRPTLRFPTGVAGRARSLALAGIAAFLAQQGAALVVAWLANRRGGEGAFTLYTWAWQLYLLPYAVLAVPLATSAFQRLASSVEAGDVDAYARTTAATTRMVVLASAAGAAALAGAALPVAQTFVLGPGSGDAAPLAAGLVAFAPGLVGYGLVAHLGRALYAQHRGRAAAVATVAGWAVVVVVDLVLVLNRAGNDVVQSLGWGNSAGMIVGGGLLVAATVRVAGAATMDGVVRTAAVAAVGAVAGGAAGYQVGQVFADASFATAVVGAVASAAVALAVLAVAVGLGDRGTARSLVRR